VRFAAFVVFGIVVSSTGTLHAQDRFEAAAQIATAHSSEFDANDTGVGGRFAWHPTALIGAEAEMNVYPRGFPSASSFSSSRIEGLFGVTVGPRFARIRPFGKLRPGFLSFHGQPVVCILIFPPPLSCVLATGRTVFALDAGGGVEVFATERTVVRVDVGDRLLKYPGPSFHDSRAVEDSFFSHDVRLSAGAGLRF